MLHGSQIHLIGAKYAKLLLAREGQLIHWIGVLRRFGKRENFGQNLGQILGKPLANLGQNLMQTLGKSWVNLEQNLGKTSGKPQANLGPTLGKPWEKPQVDLGQNLRNFPQTISEANFQNMQVI